MVIIWRLLDLFRCCIWSLYVICGFLVYCIVSIGDVLCGDSCWYLNRLYLLALKALLFGWFSLSLVSFLGAERYLFCVFVGFVTLVWAICEGLRCCLRCADMEYLSDQVTKWNHANVPYG